MSDSPNPTSDGRTPPAQRAAMFIVFFVVFIDLLGFGIVLPLIPRYAKDLMPADVSDLNKGIITGAILSVFSAMQFIFAPIWGRISDRIGRRPVLLVGLGGSVVFYGAFGLISDLYQEPGWLVLILIFLTRVGAGVSGATISTAAAVIADCTSKEKRAHGMALIGAAFGIGFTFGPLLALAALSFFPEQRGAPGYAAALLSFLALLLAVRKMPETLKTEAVSSHRGWLNIGKLFETLQTPTVGLLVFIFFIATFSFANFESTLSLLTAEAFGLSDKGNFWVFAFVGFMLMFAQGFAYRKLVKKLDEIALMRIGLIAMLVGLGSLAGVAALAADPAIQSFRFAWFLASLAVSVFGFAFLNPSVNALISRRSDPARQGEVLGINQSFSALARILGPIAGLALFFDPSTGHVLPYLTAAAMLFSILLLLPRIRRVG